jgi:uncharacterized protein YbjT (DUF2867 family)
MRLDRRTALLGTLMLWLAGCATAPPAPPAPPKVVLVAGATGQTGRLVVQQLAAEGFTVRALVRDKAKAEELGAGVELVQGDVKDPASLAAAFTGVDAVVSAIGARAAKGPDSPEFIDYQGVKNLAEAAARARVGQFVLVSSRSVTQENHPLNKMFGDVLKWKLQGENALRASGVPYTIVRPGGLLNGPARQKTVVFSQGDTETGQTTITRADVADICVQALRHPEARNRTLEAHSVAGPAVSDWRALFAALKPDAR